MEPQYLIENRYSFVFDALPFISNKTYEVETPETSFERSVQEDLAVANRLLMAGRYSTALEKYRHLRGVVASLIYPKISVPKGSLIDWASISGTGILDTVLARSADLLKRTPTLESTIPPRFRSSESMLPDAVAERFAVFEALGVTDLDTHVGPLLDEADSLIAGKEFDNALGSLQRALDMVSDRALQGAILHDMAILQERIGKRDAAIDMMQRAVRHFEQLEQPESQAIALSALAGIQARGEAIDSANSTLKELDSVRKEHNLFTIATEHAFSINGALATPTEVTPEFASQPVQLLSTRAFLARSSERQLTILGGNDQPQKIELNQDGTQNLSHFYETLSTTRDLRLLMDYLTDHTVTVAYLTHIYFWIIPMAVGDCQAALGAYAEAETEYLSTLNYRYLNQVVESVNLWIRLAELYLDWGDRLYREARNDVSEFGQAKEKYERLMRLDNSVDPNSPLYRSDKFARMADRARAVIQAVFVDAASIDENPRIQMALMRANMQLTKIAGELNYIGLGVHIPPFSFEYLQNLARYFTQHASQVEQMYIQFQSTGENEQLREQQMAQQADIAAASVELERRGLDEVIEGVDIAQANLNATNVQLQNAQQAANDFAAVRWELLELDGLQAWSSAAAVDDDEVRQTVSNATYYSATDRKRSHVLFDLARRRARIAHDVEANRLQRGSAAARHRFL